METVRPLKRNNSNAGSLGAIIRSTGYLQGGYRGALINSAIQLYNTTTEVGQIVLDTGYQRNYVPGVTGNLAGYFSINSSTDYNKLNHATRATAFAFTLPVFAKATTSDFGLNSKAWIWCSSLGTEKGNQEPLDALYELSTTTETLVNLGNKLLGATGTTRQGLSLTLCSAVCNGQYGSLTTLTHATQVVVADNVTTHPNLLGSNTQIPVGISKDAASGFYAGMNSCNVKIVYNGSTVQSMAQSTGFTYHFGESHSLTTDAAGYLMAGYSDTTGRYGIGSQHGLCQKIVFATESIVTLPDLAIPQSSGQMMPGF